MTLQNMKLNFIIDVAIELFLNNSINETSIKDIATKAGVGEATIYRYFQKKQNIVIQSVLKLQGSVYEEYFNFLQGQKGFEKISSFYFNYLSIFESHPKFYKFVAEFDAYMMLDDSAELNEYENEINKFKHIFMEAYKMGIQDGSIRKHENIEMFYYATTHSLLELCKKLSVQKEMLVQDRLIEKSSEIKVLIDSFLFRLKNL